MSANKEEAPAVEVASAAEAAPAVKVAPAVEVVPVVEVAPAVEVAAAVAPVAKVDETQTDIKEAKPVRVPVRVLLKAKVLCFEVPIDEDYKDCRRQVAETRAEEAAERASARTPEQEALEKIAAPYADSIAAATEDCENFAALLRARGPDADLSGLARISALLATHYAEWTAQQKPVAGDAPAEIDDKSAPLYVARYSRPWDADMQKCGVWGAPHVLDLNKNSLDKLFTKSDIDMFRSFKMHKRSPRVLLLERAFETPDGLVTASFVLVFAVRCDLRAEILSIGDQVADQPQEPPVSPGVTVQDLDDTATLRTFSRCTVMFNHTAFENKPTAAKVAAQHQVRFAQGLQLYEQRRLAKRNDRFAAQLPALVACTTALVSRELASLYKPSGIFAPPQTTVIEVQCHDGLIVLEDLAVLKHSQLRKVLVATGEKIEALAKRIVDERPTPEQPGPNEQELGLHHKSAVDEWYKLAELDRLAYAANPQTEVVYSFIDTASGLDAQNMIGTHFIRRINVDALLKFTKLTAEKIAAEAAPAAAAADQTPVAESESKVPVAEPESKEPVAAPVSNEPVAEPESKAPVAEPTDQEPVAAPTNDVAAIEPATETTKE